MKITDEIIQSIAEAINSAEVESSIRLVRLVDGLNTYRLELDGIVDYFTDDEGEEAIDQCYARVRELRQRKQAKAVIAAIEAALSTKTFADARAEALEEAARLIDGYQITSTSSGPCLAPRSEGNRDGLAYAAAIRALKCKT